MEGFHEFIKLHENQLISSGVPENFWVALYVKVKDEVFDAGEVFQLLKIDYDNDAYEEKDSEEEENEPTNNLEVENDVYAGPVYGLMALEQLLPSDATAIFLIDHAWTFRLKNARAQLQENTPLLERMCNMMGIENPATTEHTIECVLKNMWRYCHTYSLVANAQTNDEDRLPIWYIMDEVGSAVNHADEPNSRIVPFFNCQNGITYSLLFPKRPIEANEFITRDFVENIPIVNELGRKALLLPWQYFDFSAEDFLQNEPNAYYFTAGHVLETYNGESQQTPYEAIEQRRSFPLKVYTEYEVIAKSLTSPVFKIIDNSEEADILWLTTHFKEFSQLATESPHKFINQFPFEYVITIKDLLAIVGRRCVPYSHNKKTLLSLPHWLPTTYNLKTELVQFLAYYQKRAERHLDNHWIVKPYNLARALDQRITKDLTEIVRLSTTGPKIIQKYIQQPVLFYRDDIKRHVKFDIRYVFMLKHLQPLEAYIYRDFFLRFANHEYSLTDLDDYEKHFTVMNYRENATKDLYHLKAEEFLKVHWPQQYPNYKWENVENDILHMLYSVIECATKVPPPCGIAANAQSRAMYAADIMLEWEHDELNESKRIQPKLLEINWTPDCKRACDYYPDFFNDIFKLLFLNEFNEQIFKAITPKYVNNGGLV